MKPLIYLASPYSDTNPLIVNHRVAQAQLATARLIARGHLVFSPIVHSHQIADHVPFETLNTDASMSQWMDYDKAMIDKCDAVWVLCVDGWRESRGVKAEIEHAQSTGKRVRCIRPYDLKEYFPATRFVGAGTIYSPASTGKPPVKKFDSKTHTVYAPEYRGGAEMGMSEEVKRAVDSCFSVPSHQCPSCEAPIPAAMAKCWDCFHANLELLGTYCTAPHCPTHTDSPRYKNLDAYKHPMSFTDIEPQTTSMPEDADERNSYPMAEGLLYYFPNALAEVSKISKFGNDQHNPGQDIHWSRGKSTDHANKIIRHLVDAGKTDKHGNRHSAFVAWRALALLQEELERDLDLPMPKNAWVDEK